jgi:hypothetical protein
VIVNRFASPSLGVPGIAVPARLQADLIASGAALPTDLPLGVADGDSGSA